MSREHRAQTRAFATYETPHGQQPRHPDPHSWREPRPSYMPLPSAESHEHSEYHTQDLELHDHDISLPVLPSRTNSTASGSLGLQPDNPGKARFEFIPRVPPENAASLDWRPISLKGWFLWTNAVISIGLAAGIYAILYGVGDDRQASLTSENAHLLSVYVPTLLATISWQLFRSVFFEALRMLPYFRMADQQGKITRGEYAHKSVGGSFFPYPFASYGDDPVVKCSAQVFLFIGGFLVASKAVFIGSQKTTDGWILTIHPGAAYYLMAAYTLMTFFYVFIYFWARNKSTGLKWDPASNLDHLALFWRTNAMSEIALLPLNFREAQYYLSKQKRWRIGYWTQQEVSSAGTKSIGTVYGIGTLNTVSSEKAHSCKGPYCQDDRVCTCETGACDFGLHIFRPSSGPFYLVFHFVLLTTAAAALAFASYKGAFHEGFQLTGSWLDMVPAPDWMVVAKVSIQFGDSVAASLLLRALPTLVAGYFANGVIAFVDIRMRDTQCFSDLALGPLASSKSLAIGYVTKLSLLVPITAIDQGHYRLTFVSSVSTLAPLAPVFVAGLFIFESPAAETVLVRFAKVSLAIVCGYIVLFAAVLIVAWPRKRERLLRQTFTIADTVRPLLHSWLMDEPLLDDAMTQQEPEKFQAKVLLVGYLYQLGIIEHAACGGRHLGVELVSDEAGQRFRNIVSVKELLRKQKKHGTTWTQRRSYRYSGD